VPSVLWHIICVPPVLWHIICLPPVLWHIICVPPVLLHITCVPPVLWHIICVPPADPRHTSAPCALHTCMHVSMPTLSGTQRARAHAHMQACIRAHAHTYTHAHTHMHRRMHACPLLVGLWRMPRRRLSWRVRKRGSPQVLRAWLWSSRLQWPLGAFEAPLSSSMPISCERPCRADNRADSKATER